MTSGWKQFKNQSPSLLKTNRRMQDAKHGVHQVTMKPNQSVEAERFKTHLWLNRFQRGLALKYSCRAFCMVAINLMLFLPAASGQELNGPLSSIGSQKESNALRLSSRSSKSLRAAKLTPFTMSPEAYNRSGSLSTMASRVAATGDEAFTEPIETIKIAAAENGIIGNVAVKRGDTVESEDLLFELDMSVLEASRRLATAKASSKARLKAAEVEFEAKTKSYDKRVKLLADRAGSPEEVEKAKTEVELARQSIEAIVEEQEQASLETKRIETQMEQRRTRSPIDGVVVDVRRKPGEYISSADPHIATVVQLDTLRVVFHLPTSRAATIKSGDVANLLLPETGQRTEGTVEYVAPVTNADSGRVRVEVLVENKSREFRSGVRCRILESSTRRSMLTPESESSINR